MKKIFFLVVITTLTTQVFAGESRKGWLEQQGVRSVGLEQQGIRSAGRENRLEEEGRQNCFLVVKTEDRQILLVKTTCPPQQPPQPMR